MNLNSISIFLIVSLLVLSSCIEKGPQPSSLVGLYEVSVRLKNSVVDKNSIKQEIKSAMNQAEDEIKKAKSEIDEAIDLSSIDTSTIEGKIDYAAKKLGKSVAEVGVEMGDLGKDIGEAVSSLAVNSLDFSEKFLNNLKFDLELQADGDIKSKESILYMGLNNARWAIEADNFIFTKDDNGQPQKMKIVNRSQDGFTLEHDEIFLDFIRKVQ